MPGLSSTLCGVAGEYYVATELTRRGYIASITLRNTKGVDLLVSDENASKQVGIQVKTNQNNKRELILSKKAEELNDENIFYVFVIFKKEYERPDFFIVPSIDVAECVNTTHAEWLSTPGRGGRQHQDSNIRKFRDQNGKYIEKWTLLNL